VPRQIDGLVILEDIARGRGRVGIEQRHLHAELEVHLVAAGRGTFLVGEQRLEAELATMLFIPPGHEHTLLEASRDFRRWMLLFRPRLVRRILPAPAARLLLSAESAAPLEQVCRSVAKQDARALFQLYAETRGSVREPASLFNAAVGYALARSFAVFSNTALTPAASTLHPGVAEAVRRLRSDVPPPGRSELARRCGLSESHLSKLSAQVGVSLSNFRNRCRLERFFELYGDGTRCKLMSAALDAGFGSYPQFHRVFRAELGYPPGEHVRRSGRGV
jgi:AraC-like DNA-binding protein